MGVSSVGRPLSREALRILGSLEDHGMLLVQDAKLPSLVTEVVGCAIKGSWWAHPANKEIFRILNEVASHCDTFITKLLNKKQTLLTRTLFAPVLAIGRAREPWQMRGLPQSALELLDRVDRGEYVLASGDMATKLELAVLVASQEIHTGSGAHAKELISWPAFAKARRVSADPHSLAASKAELESVAARLETTFNARAKLPWSAGAALGSE